jgi:hypothetical protein
MKNNRSITLKFIVLLVSLSFLFSGPLTAGMTMKHGAGGHGMTMHHQHTMLNHALGMALEGSNLVMLGQMGMAKGVDKVSVDHGKMMIKNGRALYNEVMTGKTMTGMHSGGTSPTDNPMMEYTHKLASAQLKVFDLLKEMSSEGHGGHGMAMHHQHTMLNHALKMALEGSNLIMLGQMGMAPGLDEVSVDHGKTMIKHARSLYNETMTGKTMTDMHGKGTSPEKDSGMAYTHKLASAQLKVIDLLKMMPTVTE